MLTRQVKLAEPRRRAARAFALLWSHPGDPTSIAAHCRTTTNSFGDSGGKMAVLRNGAGDPSRHQQVIETLAKENSTSVDHVRELFETEHARLQAEARVKTYVAVIATRLVRNVLHAERNSANA
jgi:hypothetical protein